MPIDPRIPLGVQPPQIQSPLEVYSTIQQIEGQREAVELRRLAAEEKRQEVAQKQALEQALQASIIIDPKTKRITFDREALLANAPASVAYKLQRELDDDEVSANKLAESLLDLEGKKRDYRGSISRTIRASGYNPDVFQRLMHGAQGFGALDDETAASYASLGDTGQIQAIVDDYIAQTGGEAAKLEKITTVDDQGREVTQFVEPTPGASYPTAPQAADVITVQTVDEQGRPVTKIVPKQAGATYPNQPPAPRDERLVQVIGPNGQPIWVRESQAVGQPAGAAPGEGGAVKLTGAQQEDMATMLTVQDLGKAALELGDRIKWRGVGPVAGPAGAMGARWFGAGGADAERLRNLVGNIQGTIAKLRGGTAFSAQEQILLERYTPTTSDSELQIKAKLKSLDEFITAKRENTLRVAGGQYTPRERPRATKQKIGRFEIEVEVQ